MPNDQDMHWLLDYWYKRFAFSNSLKAKLLGIRPIQCYSRSSWSGYYEVDDQGVWHCVFGYSNYWPSLPDDQRIVM